LLSASTNFAASESAHLKLICALAQQCFLNEYVYSVTDEEEAVLAALVEANRTFAEPSWMALALIACYLPLGRKQCGSNTRKIPIRAG
jgi:hypothetical protein